MAGKLRDLLSSDVVVTVGDLLGTGSLLDLDVAVELAKGGGAGSLLFDFTFGTSLFVLAKVGGVGSFFDVTVDA